MMVRSSGTSAITLMRGLVHAAAELGVDSQLLCSRVGIERSQLDSDESIATLLLARAWHLAPELSGDPLFGLHAGLHAEFGTYDILDYLFSTSATLGDGCRAIERYHRVVVDIWRVTLVVDGDCARLTHWVPQDYVEPLWHAWDYFFSGSLLRIRTVLGRELRPTVIRLMHHAPEGAEEYERVFGCPVEFDHPIGEFVFDARFLSLPLLSANAALHRLVRRHADDLLARVPSEKDLLQRARILLPELLAEPNLSLAFLARRLGVAPRTLQRKLADHGLRYQELIDRTREEQAARALESGALAIQEIASELGFQSTAAFTKAFQRWRGMSPTQYRRQHGFSVRE